MHARFSHVCASRVARATRIPRCGSAAKILPSIPSLPLALAYWVHSTFANQSRYGQCPPTRRRLNTRGKVSLFLRGRKSKSPYLASSHGTKLLSTPSAIDKTAIARDWVTLEDSTEGVSCRKVVLFRETSNSRCTDRAICLTLDTVIWNLKQITLFLRECAVIEIFQTSCASRVILAIINY